MNYIQFWIIASVLTQSTKQCIPRTFESGSYVCVCNSTYCDSVEVDVPDKGHFRSYLSSINSGRLEAESGRFDEDSIDTITIRLNLTKKYQEILGFGGSFTDSAGLNIKKLSGASQEQLLRTYFSSGGSQYNMARLPIGGSDFSTRPYTLDDVPGDTSLSNFSLAQEDYDYKIPYMKQAQELNPNLKFIASSWTAPPWMKTNNDFVGALGQVKKEYYQTYADYSVKFLEAYKEHGLRMWAITTGNEPESGYRVNKPANSMGWTPSSVAEWTVNNLEPAIEASTSNDTIILSFDDTRLSLSWWLDDMYKANSMVDKYTAGISVHWHDDQQYPPSLLDEMHDKFPNQFILMTEACIVNEKNDLEFVKLGNWSRGEDYMHSIIEYMNHWSVGWIDWNLVLDKEGGPNWANNFVDAPIIINPETDEFFKQPMYYALAHFSKFVSRGSVRVDLSNDSHIESVAFITPDDQVVIVLYNPKDDDHSITIIDPDQGNISIQMPGHSFRTIIYKR